MSYFDSKEELLNIELTPYGRRCLIEGKFKPAYYSFHDDDVLYNVEFTGLTENISKSYSRISEETPYLKTNARKKSIEATLKQTNPQEKDAYEISSIGKAAYGSQKAPAWSLKMLDGQIENLVKTYNHKAFGKIQIPQVNLQPVFTRTKLVDRKNMSYGYDKIEFDDGMVLEFEAGNISLELEELNVDSSGNDFELELYEILEENNEEVLKQIQFIKQPEIIKNNILLDVDEDAALEDGPEDIAENRFFIVADNFGGAASSDTAEDTQLTETVKPLKTGPFGDDC